MQEPDVVIVGSGIAGGALATVLADGGLRVLILERQLEYSDQVRGEILWPWGVRLARTLGVERVLLNAGAQFVPRLDLYDEGASDRLRFEVGEAVSGIEGSLNISHPRACSAFADAASSLGADARKGVRDVVRDRGAKARALDGERRGSARPTAGSSLGGRPPLVRPLAGPNRAGGRSTRQLIAGMLVDNVEGMDDEVNVMAREADLIFYSFPQQAGRSRLYLCFPTGQESRFAGAEDRSVSWTRAASTVLLTWPIGQQRVREGRARRSPGKTAVCHVRSWTESF